MSVHEPAQKDPLFSTEGMMVDMLARKDAIRNFFAHRHTKAVVFSGSVAGAVAMLLTGSGTASEIAAGLGGTIGGLFSAYSDPNKQRDPNNEYCMIDDIFP